jgi:hypothetical protein
MSRRRIRKRIDAIPGVRILKLPGGVTAILGSGVADEFVEVMPIREAGETFNHWLDRCRDTMGDLTSEAGHKLAKFGNVYFREQTEPGAVGAITGTGETP